VLGNAAFHEQPKLAGKRAMLALGDLAKALMLVAWQSH
jgi:hypothetical protein